MLKKNVFIVAILMFSMIAMYGYVPMAKADSLTSAKDTLSTSAPTVAATHTITFAPNVNLIADDVVTFTFNAGFTGIDNLNATCPGNGTEGGAGQVITCTVVDTLATDTPYIMTLTGVTNPGVGYYDVTVGHDSDQGAASSKMIVYIISQVTVNATVDASLTFAVAGTATSTTINGDDTTGSTTATSMQFGTLDYDQAIMGQRLAVTTNADSGYTVTVQQDGNLRTAGSADIDSYSTTTVADWAEPTPNINDDSTWGYMGVASGDTVLTVPGVVDGDITDGFYVGFDGTSPLEVMRHTGPADGTTEHIGWEFVAYSVEISALQEAGDYSNTLTYICTPTF
ncbi:hypothetical protein A2303_06465 [Candidatus Falkowbacteria bacterium RIFOXYB2_FULL_47_14]|uniref:Uncharacterized protein n=1 Tax=Candidatus Falkowbacteria bacterium RIFOXYA2_FULL_47_19 TaxID=1797994 RepID=A0A1F5SE99_9BACT|nr:MAG: hypothetical protein A2227_04530 [Candidatus Falkowbacteria bacterium RIFOXYA2_FULL_47_19]OGF35667.1 MAG: hypothetical protein A2468_04430 [Candidatus Falkowbacteria bacterium RIFOXYC2_FULL_46_15]OGF43182.1 MAG: hypothetical protein A2303_06465 [Candidatus Falkowbacteria bacterium RIFOXYB2_FULL_47_14]